SVLLPDPFSPMIACTSPARRSKLQARTACVGPKALARPTVRSANAAGAWTVSGLLTRRPWSCRGRALRGHGHGNGLLEPLRLALGVGEQRVHIALAVVRRQRLRAGSQGVR